MEFKKFANERKRMCDKYSVCFNGCPIWDLIKNTGRRCAGFILEHPEEAEKAVEKWSKENPVETRLTKLIKQYPMMDLRKSDGCPNICVKNLGYDSDCHKSMCKTCWGKEV